MFDFDPEFFWLSSELGDWGEQNITQKQWNNEITILQIKLIKSDAILPMIYYNI